MKIETLKAIVNAFNSASDDANRRTLNYVCLTPQAGTLTIRATDGHVLANFTVEEELFKGMSNTGDYLASPDQLPMLKVLLKEFKTVGVVPSEVVTASKTAGASIVLTGGSIRIEFRHAKTLGIEFPNTKQLYPTYLEAPTQIGFNPELLMDLFKSLRDHDKATDVTLVIKDRLSAIRVICGEREGLLMPMRTATKEYCPKAEDTKESA